MGSVGANTTIVSMPQRTEPTTERTQVDNINGWRYPEITENVDRLEEAFRNARSTARVSAVVRQLRAQEDRITAEIERLENGTADVNGNRNVLLTQRRRVRQLLRRIGV